MLYNIFDCAVTTPEVYESLVLFNSQWFRSSEGYLSSTRCSDFEVRTHLKLPLKTFCNGLFGAGSYGIKLRMLELRESLESLLCSGAVDVVSC
jgi:hypothetical protein